MTVTSAIPTNLQVFATTLVPARTTCTNDTASAAQQANAMIAACAGAGVSSTNLTSLSNLLGTFAVNEQYVATVHDELVKADHDGSSPASVDSGVVLTALQTRGLAAPPPAVVVQPSEVFGVPPTSGFVDDPVCAANGNFVHAETDLMFPGHSAALNVFRFYNSLAVDTDGAFGPGWTSLADLAMAFPGEGEIRVRIADGATVTFRPPPSADHGAPWPANGRRDMQLRAVDDHWVLDESPERRWRFDGRGLLLGADLGAARLEVERIADVVVGASERRSGRSVRFEWATIGGGRRIVAASSNDGRRVEYDYDRAGVLCAVAGLGGAARYDVDGPLLVSARDADGVALFHNVYDGSGRVTQQTSAFGRVTDYAYGSAGTTVITDQFGVRNAMVHDRRGNLTAVVDTDGRAMRMAYDHHARTTSVTDREGNVWRYEFDDATGDLVARVDPDGRHAKWTWDEQHRLLTDTDRAGNVTTQAYQGNLRSPSTVVAADGGVATAVHDERGLPTMVTDPDGVITRFEWDRDGQLVAVTDALGGVTRLEFDDAGLYVRLLDAVGVETVVERDPSGRIVRHVVPGATSTYRYTPAGRVGGGTEPGDLPWSASFGEHGKPVAITDGLGSTARFQYDTNGGITAVIAPDGAEYRNRFDAMGQLLDNVDPSGAMWMRRLDGNGNIVEFVDGIGRRSTRSVDAWGRTLVSTAPDGAVTTYTYHPTGGIASVTGPDGRRWTTEVDACGREVSVTDPLGRRAQIGYTAAGRVRERRSPTGRTERYGYDAAGRLTATTDAAGTERTVSRDARGQVVGFAAGSSASRIERTPSGLISAIADEHGSIELAYDQRGLLRSVTDATGASAHYDWDARGLLESASDGSGATTTYTYDQRGRLETQRTPTAAATSYAYDATGYLSTLTEPASGVTRFRRDAVGHVEGIRRADGTGWDVTRDAVGRTSAVTSAAGDELGQYAYDTAGRLIEAVSADGFVTTFLWDDGDEVVGVGGSDGSRRYVRDADGLIVAEEHDDGTRVEFVRDARGAITSIVDAELGGLAVPVALSADSAVQRDASGRILGRADGSAYRYDTAGRLVESMGASGAVTAFEYDRHGLLARETGPDRDRRFAYDSAGRLTGILDAPGGRSHFRYDAAGRRTNEAWSDGTIVTYAWTALGQLAAITRTHPAGAVETTRIDSDALGHIVRAGGLAIGWDRVRTHLPDRVDGRRRSGELSVAGTFILGDRPFDPATRQFLSPDRLDPLPGSPGAASPYTFAWLDPINLVDPSGMQPISQAQFDEIRKKEEQGKLGAAWEAIKKDPWGAVGMALVVAAGVGLCFVPGGQAIGVGILIGVGTSAAMGIATGNFDPRAVAISGVIGGITGGTASAATSIPKAIAIGAATEGGGSVATQLATGDHTINWNQVAVSAAAGGVTGGVAQKFFPAGGTSEYDGFLPPGTTAKPGPPPISEADRLAGRVDDFHSVLQKPDGTPDLIAQKQRVTTVMSTKEGPDVIASGKRDLNPAQREVAGPGDVLGKNGDLHAETTAMEAAQKAGLTPARIATSAPICPNCETAITNSGGVINADRFGAVWPH